jgi:hypothetical protein
MPRSAGRLTGKERRVLATAHHERPAIMAMYAGLGFAVVALIVPYIDHGTASLTGPGGTIGPGRREKLPPHRPPSGDADPGPPA